MKFIHDWREALNKAWSVRIAILMTLLSAADQLLPALGGFMSPLAYAALSIVLVVARLTVQTNESNTKPT